MLAGTQKTRISGDRRGKDRTNDLNSRSSATDQALEETKSEILSSMKGWDCSENRDRAPLSIGA
jgi:hypothetical protein